MENTLLPKLNLFERAIDDFKCSLNFVLSTTTLLLHTNIILKDLRKELIALNGTRKHARNGAGERAEQPDFRDILKSRNKTRYILCSYGIY